MVPLPGAATPTASEPRDEARAGEPAVPSSEADAGSPTPSAGPLDAVPPSPERREATREPATTEVPAISMRSLDDVGAVAPPEPAPSDPAPVPAPTPAPEPSDVWTVALGDHLWSIAAEAVHDAGAPDDERAVLDYWTALIDANRDRLADPENPDLLFPGQVLVLPPVAAAVSGG
jgi:nucleoid-associated protein YgaU